MSRVAILGTGLIGGSIGFDLVARGREVVGFDRDPTAVRRAVDRGAVTTAADGPADAVEGAALVIAAVPPHDFGSVARGLAAHLAPDAVVTDVGSAKFDVVRAGEAALGARFVGGHPMAGSERHGIDGARPGLFEDAWWILTPTATTSPGAYQQVAELAASLGARPVALDAAEHDSLVARVSHLPQVVASALVDLAVGDIPDDPRLRFAGGGFRDTTRIAASDPDLWVSIARANRAAIGRSIAALQERLGDVAGWLASADWEALRTFFERARGARVELFDKPVYGGAPVTLQMLIPDRPGVLAEVTTAAGQLGANIEDLRIMHSAEGGRGTLELVVPEGPHLARLVAVLEDLGYDVDSSSS
ncbi:MAG: prephenate dehydrogenase/arogenate dehydrogenase family protein [Actinomycetota bacterium]